MHIFVSPGSTKILYLADSGCTAGFSWLHNHVLLKCRAMLSILHTVYGVDTQAFSGAYCRILEQQSLFCASLCMYLHSIRAAFFIPLGTFYSAKANLHKYQILWQYCICCLALWLSFS